MDIVRGAVKNIRAQAAREVLAKGKIASKAVGKTERAWKRIADRTLKKAAEAFTKTSVEKSEKPAESRHRRTHVASSR